MIKQEVRKIKILVAVLLLLIAAGGANIAWGLATNRWFSVCTGLFCVALSSWCVMRNIRTIERYARVGVEEEQIFKIEGTKMPMGAKNDGQSLSESYYLKILPCKVCGKGPDFDGIYEGKLQLYCKRCGRYAPHVGTSCGAILAWNEMNK